MTRQLRRYGHLEALPLYCYGKGVTSNYRLPVNCSLADVVLLQREFWEGGTLPSQFDGLA